MEHYDFRRVSVTALVPAFARGEHTEIPWAKEMLAVLQERGASLSGGPWSEYSVNDYAPLFDARFRAVTRLIELKGATQVLELAAGLSPRGMELARRGILYVEADLDESIAMKREVIAAILGELPENLHLCSASVIDRAQLLACCSPFARDRPVAITAEGLLRYLTFEEKTHLAAIVYEILERYGGWWITPDIHLQSWAQRQSQRYREHERELLGRSLASNYFSDLEHAQAFFENCGFSVESLPLMEGIGDQISPFHNEEVMRELNDRRIFVVAPKR